MTEQMEDRMQHVAVLHPVGRFNEGKPVMSGMLSECREFVLRRCICLNDYDPLVESAYQVRGSSNMITIRKGFQQKYKVDNDVADVQRSKE